ncbi:ATP-dependent DNA ligase [Rhodococcus sp. F64268]|uniref:ATP-dependent DNA ligase n=1 Tax=Rhodococcus sp. F64268 TaxID=2926402 RepID=UPI001FF3AC62|nr:ATP-dependent DNA ligase [Rhodococcus sp. F64268]MCK0089524.1 ATP-dependent DNA ligase [Rhodococcus sp. F64268]
MPTRTIGDRRITLTNLDKVLYPRTGTTKGEVIDYYVAVAEVMLPHVVDRPGTRKRWPNGVAEPAFFEKNLAPHAPSWLDRRTVHHKQRSVTYPVFDSVAGMAWLGQQAALELHVPQWRFAGSAPGPATRLVFDLDPGPGAGLAQCAQVARHVRDMVAELGWQTYPVTSGSKGLHLYVPLDRQLASGGASTVARQVATNLATLHPDLVTATMAKAVRGGKVFVDWSQNNAAKTTVAPYSLRGRDEPWVAAPRSWAELDDPDLRQLTFDEVLERIVEHGDLLEGLDPASGDLRLGTDDNTANDALADYRRKRNAARTPEPVPSAITATGNDDRFVIQEHHARRLHYDLRLERDGVLASWAVPKNLPEDAGRNHLAVRTEDHPLEYLDFHGTIPSGEYGAGTMTVWDTGTYDTEKWRDDEVIVRLHGEKVEGRYAFIRTEKDQWLAHRMKQQSGSGRMEEFPVGLRPMLATAGDVEELEGAAWAFEGKWDGYRAVVEVRNGTVRVRARSGRDVTGEFPALGELGHVLDGHAAVLDGEIVAVDASGITSFEQLQRGASAEYRVFDLLYLDGVTLVGKTYDDRRRVLDALAAAAGRLAVPDQLTGDGAAALATSLERGWEGVVAKRRDSVYLPGKRSAAWVKAKNWLTQSVVIGGYRAGQGNRAGSFGSLLLGIPADSGLVYAGRVGTGFDDRTLAELTSSLRGRRREESPFVDELPAVDQRDAVWVEPDLVGEVRFAAWTEGGRLRHPSWRGLRSDLDPHDVRRE